MEGERCGELLRICKRPAGRSGSRMAGAYECGEQQRDIREVLSADGTYAVVLKSTGKPVGCAGLTVGAACNMPVPEDEGEIGCWLGTPYWGQGIIPEAVKELIRYGFEDLGLKRIWYAYFDGNEKSKRVAEKCGFRYHHTNRDLEWKLLNKTVTEHVHVLEKNDRNDEI